MFKQVERVRKTENRTRSELMREALREYISRRYPVVSVSRAELAAIRKGRAEFARGEMVGLDELMNELAPSTRQAGRKTY